MFECVSLVRTLKIEDVRMAISMRLVPLVVVVVRTDYQGRLVGTPHL